MIGIESFWAGLLSAVTLALIVDLGCLLFLWRNAPPPADRAVVSMLRRIALFNTLPLLSFTTYFGYRLLAFDSDAVSSVGIVAYASAGYLLALLAIVLPAITSAVLVYKRKSD